MVALDITELIRHPVRTGIQRVVRGMVRRWPTDVPLCLARFEAGAGLVPVSPSVKTILMEETSDSAVLSTEELRIKIARNLDQPVQPLPPRYKVFVPELFYDSARCRFYHQLLTADHDSVGFLVYDFIPWLYPDVIRVVQSEALMPYLRLIRLASKLAFISEQTRLEYHERIMRGVGVTGPVFELGSDGLEMERQSFAPGRRAFVCVGSIGGRKNQNLVLRAFQNLWQRGRAIPLVIIGKGFTREDALDFESVDKYPLFTWLRDATDEDVRNALRGARATIFASTLEGYGLPPVESLHVGIPVICAEGVPSIVNIPEGGLIRLPQVTPEAIAEAVLNLMDDDAARWAWDATRKRSLATWEDFARQVAHWADSL